MNKKPSYNFIALMALLMSFVALAIDVMLPALSLMAKELMVEQANDIQLIISMVFLGMAPGLFIFGPISDTYGRKKAILLGISIFSIGAIVSYFSQSLEVMLLGRFLQGLGGASCRVVTIAIIRDKFIGREMAKTMSLIMLVFILVPTLAPLLGDLILTVADWRSIFLSLLLLGVISAIWLTLNLEETLPLDKRIPLNFKSVKNGMVETITHKASRTYTIATGLAFGAFLGYITTAQQIIQVQYNLGKLFSITFGCFALCIGAASFLNSRLVESLGMQKLCIYALRFIILWAAIFLPISIYFNGHPSFILFCIYLAPTLFCFGILFGNFNSLAMEPLGHIAGVANSVISGFSTFLSVILSAIIGKCYNNTITPLQTGFLLLGLISLLLVQSVKKADD